MDLFHYPNQHLEIRSSIRGGIMYRIKVFNAETQTMFIEYGFSKYMKKKLHFFANRNSLVYKIIDVSELRFNFSTFMKCLTHYTEIKQEG